MKTNIIEVGLPTSKLAEVQPALNACLQETGDVLIGHQVYDDLTLLVVHLINDTIQYHLATLTSAFARELISSFQVVNCQLFKAIFKHEQFQTALRDFPLHAGESWFTAADNNKAAYLCLTSLNLSQEQISWLATQTTILQWSKAS